MFKTPSIQLAIIVFAALFTASTGLAAENDPSLSDLFKLMRLAQQQILARAREQAEQQTSEFQDYVRRVEGKAMKAEQSILAHNFFFYRARHELLKLDTPELLWIHTEGRTGLTSVFNWIARFERTVNYVHLHLGHGGNSEKSVEALHVRALEAQVLVLDDFSYLHGSHEWLIRSLSNLPKDRIVVFVDNKSTVSQLSQTSFARIDLVDEIQKFDCEAQFLN